MTRKDMYGVGIRGAGQVARQHAEAVAANPRLRIAAVCSRTRENAEKLARACAPGARVYDRYEDMLDDPAVDIVSECMPNHLHAREAVLALEAGRHLILEKPAAVTREELAALRAAARKAEEAGLRTVVSFVLRWHPLIVNIRNLLARGAIGDVYYAETDYWHGIKPAFSSYEWIRKKEFAGGAMITGGCHAADLARYLRGDIAEVMAYSCKQRTDFDYPTTYVAAVRFRDGGVGKISASLDGLLFPYQFNIDLLGSRGAIRDNRLFSRELLPHQTDWTVLPCPTPNSGAVSHHPFKEEIDNLADSISGGAPVLSDLLDACRSMEVALAVTESAESGKPVRISAE